jgi:hypothetical protein
MAEQVEGQVPEVKETPEAAQEAPQLSAIEQRALDQGWVPQDEWQGDPDDWRPAKEYVDRGELLKSISELKRELRLQKEGVQEFRKHHEQVKELAYKQALADLRAQKKVALENGDHDAVVEIDEAIAETREKQKAQAVEPKAAPQSDGPHPDFVRWEQRNGWYRNDRAMKAVADEVARDLVSRGEQDLAKVLVEVDKEVRRAFPAKFENPRRAGAPSVEGNVRNPRSAKDDTLSMTDVEKNIMNKILRTGAITKEKYLEEFKKTRAG